MKYIIFENLNYGSLNVTTISQIIRKFNISKYNAKKYILELIKEGSIEISMLSGGWTEDGPYPPIKGYKITKEIKNSEIFLKMNLEKSNFFSGY